MAIRPTPDRRRTPNWRFGAATALILGGCFTTPAAAQRDYAPTSRAWNGLSDLVDLASESGTPVLTPDALDLSDLNARDGLIVIYPTGDAPPRALGAFLRAGGRAAVADDFGGGDALLSPYGIRITRPSAGSDGVRLRDNPALPVAEPHTRIRHPLTSGVRALVTNHPAALRHSELEPLFTLGGGDALVMVGAVGEGRLVAIGDPSLFINNMLQLRGNRAFAANLLHYLDGGRGGRLWLVSGDTPMIRRFRDPRDPLARLHGWLSDLASVDMPPVAVTLTSLLLVTLFILVATSSLPRHSPYVSATMLPSAPPAGGFVGRVAFFRDRPTHLLHPLMVYKHELEGELVRRLGLRGRPQLGEVIDRLRKRGLSERELAALRSLLTELDRLRSRLDRPPGTPRIGERKFRSMVDAGERILARIDPESP
jgi:hypothetical protein